MRDLSMHMLDIAFNSIQSGAKLVSLSFQRGEDDTLVFTAKDDGRGMSPELLSQVTDPFVTTLKGKRTGLGIPLLEQNAKATGGNLRLESEPLKGTRVVAVFHTGHPDCIPVGMICDALVSLIVLNPQFPDFLFEAEGFGRKAVFDTRPVRSRLWPASLAVPEALAWIRESIEEEFKPILEVSTI